jgi:uncharacterized protein YndB with AHSA1/START domain
MGDGDTVTKNVVVTRIFDAPVEVVWNAWVEPELVKQWWGPAGFTAPVAEMDFREGGRSLVCMRAPAEYGGQDLYNTWTYRRIVPMREIEFVQHFADQDGNRIDPASLGLPPGIPEDVRHVITFASAAGNKTEMTVTEFGYPNDEIVAISKAGMEQCVDKMAAALQEGRAGS